MLWFYTAFIVFVVTMLALDLGVFHRKAHIISIKEALAWSAMWISLALLFSIFIYFGYENHWQGLGTVADPVDGLFNTGHMASLKYLTGYLIEESLSMDNLFVIAMILNFFSVPALQQHRVLFWGILAALVLRGVMIAIGATLVARFHWILYFFGAFLVFTGIRMLKTDDSPADMDQNLLVRMTRRFFKVSTRFYGDHFAVKAGTPEAEMWGKGDPVLAKVKPGAWMLTPLALALMVVETADVVFAVDSIPAIFAITADPFIVFTSNIFAILGLRSLFFALAGMMRKFHHLKTALALILTLVGVKMLAAHWLKDLLGAHFNLYLLGMVLLLLAGGVVASLFSGRKPEHT